MASGKRDDEGGDHGFCEQNEQVDATVLQCQNQKLVQQLEVQKAEVHKLEAKFKELRDRQNSYDFVLMAVNKKWNQLVDDLVLFGLRAGGDLKYLQEDYEDYSTDTSCPPEKTFLFRLLRKQPVTNDGQNEMIKFVQEALASRHLATLDLMKQLQETISARRATNESLTLALCGKLSCKDSVVQLKKFDESLREVVTNMHHAVDILNQKHKKYMDDIRQCMDNHSIEQLETKRLSGELEESLAELEESRRKLAILQMQKHGTAVGHSSVTNAVNGSKCPDRSNSLKELKESIEEAQTLAESRLLELKAAQEDMSTLSKELEDAENQFKDDKFVFSSKLYTLTNDKLQHMNMELARYKVLIESLQADSTSYVAKEKELSTKAELVDVALASINNFDSKIADLDLQIQKFITENNELEIKFEEAEQDLGRKDIKDEIHVMASALSKELEMMETQLNRSRNAASESFSLREEANSLRTLLTEKINEHKILSDRYAEQMVEMKYLKSLIEDLEEEKEELQIFLDMHGQECHSNRTIMEIVESEHKAKVQAEMLKATLDEHSLELRVKAAYDSEATCQQRLSTAEAEIPDLRAKLTTSERDVLELKEAIRIKDSEAEAYISEIETIGQAYEDMQTQNQHLLQQVANRDDYNIKLVSDSVKMKQTHSSLLSEKQSMLKRLQQVNASLEFYRGKVVSCESQMKALAAEAVRASLENRNLNINLEKTKLELVDTEKELKLLKSTVSSTENEYEQNQRRIAELRTELERERNERKKLEEELEEVRSEVIELSPENQEASIRKLQDEINECKAILKCGVCFDRPKEVVITKCFHLFCYPCIHRNLEIRHRKCPGCGTPFGQSDVREVKI